MTAMFGMSENLLAGTTGVQNIRLTGEGLEAVRVFDALCERLEEERSKALETMWAAIYRETGLPPDGDEPYLDTEYLADFGFAVVKVCVGDTDPDDIGF